MNSSNEYLHAKHPGLRPDDLEAEGLPPGIDKALLDAPIILLGRGGSGTRLASVMARDLGIFTGAQINDSGDCMDMVDAVYRGVLDKFCVRAGFQRERIVPRLREAAARMLQSASVDAGPWGFKLPETMLLMPELDLAFPRARFVHLVRDPLGTCLRRTHMSSRSDNPIGRAVIPAAYRHCGRDVELALGDAPEMRMAYTTIHQIESVTDYAEAKLKERFYAIRFEDVVRSPERGLARLSAWLDLPVVSREIAGTVDASRAATPESDYDKALKQRVQRVLLPLRRKLGYAGRWDRIREAGRAFTRGFRG